MIKPHSKMIIRSIIRTFQNIVNAILEKIGKLLSVTKWLPYLVVLILFPLLFTHLKTKFERLVNWGVFTFAICFIQINFKILNGEQHELKTPQFLKCLKIIEIRHLNFCQNHAEIRQSSFFVVRLAAYVSSG